MAPIPHLTHLERLYTLYDRFLAGQATMACCRRCADCCTQDVTLTSLEGLYLKSRLTAAQWSRLIDQLHRAAGQARYRPLMTTNALARHCREGKDPPPETFPETRRPCPVLEDACCPIYEWRPFGCRCLVSRRPCGPQGYAEVDEWVLTVNTVFMQAIEHLDRPGCFGNFTDVILALDAAGATRRSPPITCEAHGLLANQPLPALMIPPSHQARAATLVAQIRQVLEGVGS
jgi:hypothetical protein